MNRTDDGQFVTSWEKRRVFETEGFQVLFLSCLDCRFLIFEILGDGPAGHFVLWEA
jgi:predicted amidohydrolase